MSNNAEKKLKTVVRVYFTDEDRKKEGTPFGNVVVTTPDGKTWRAPFWANTNNKTGEMFYSGPYIEEYTPGQKNNNPRQNNASQQKEDNGGDLPF